MFWWGVVGLEGVLGFDGVYGWFSGIVVLKGWRFGFCSLRWDYEFCYYVGGYWGELLLLFVWVYWLIVLVSLGKVIWGLVRCMWLELRDWLIYEVVLVL